MEQVEDPEEADQQSMFYLQRKADQVSKSKAFVLCHHHCNFEPSVKCPFVFCPRIIEFDFFALP